MNIQLHLKKVDYEIGTVNSIKSINVYSSLCSQNIYHNNII